MLVNSGPNDGDAITVGGTNAPSSSNAPSNSDDPNAPSKPSLFAEMLSDVSKTLTKPFTKKNKPAAAEPTAPPSEQAPPQPTLGSQPVSQPATAPQLPQSVPAPSFNPATMNYGGQYLPPPSYYGLPPSASRSDEEWSSHWKFFIGSAIVAVLTGKMATLMGVLEYHQITRRFDATILSALIMITLVVLYAIYRLLMALGNFTRQRRQRQHMALMQGSAMSGQPSTAYQTPGTALFYAGYSGANQTTYPTAVPGTYPGWSYGSYGYVPVGGSSG